MDTDTRQRPASGHRSFLPRRSRADRKLGGVAGGLGRAFRIDPVLIRVAFVVLAIFGGSGVLLYCLGWLLMPGEDDEVSAIEALAGRGQSSVSTALTIVLIIVGLSSAGSVFSWGLPFWPVVIAAVIVFALVRQGRKGSCGGRGRRGPGRRTGPDWGRPGPDWGRRADDLSQRAAAWGERAGERAQRWADDLGRRWSAERGEWGGDGHPGGSPSTGTGPASPFGRPAFWEGGDRAGHGMPGSQTAAGWAAPDPADRQSGAPAAPAAGHTVPVTQPGQTSPDSPDAEDLDTKDLDTKDLDTKESVGAGTSTSAQQPSPQGLLGGGRGTPPSWDPLGVAPFAWDLPDPEPESTSVATGAARDRGVLGRLFLGLTLVTGGLLAGGVFAGWWILSWGMIAGIALAVLGVGLLVASLRGAGGRPLIGPGIFLALVTLALTATGISGTTGFGQQTWTPTTPNQVRQSYVWNAGQATLDLSKLEIPAGSTVTTDLLVKGGQATIVVPRGVAVDAHCSAQVGNVDCLGKNENGMKPDVTVHRASTDSAGTLNVTVHNNGGQAEVRSHG